MTARADSWQQIRRKGWADEVDEDWGSSGELASPLFDDATNHYKGADGVWHEDINVERGQSQQRLDLDSGFMRSIRQNQYARDEHEQAWQDAYGYAPEFQQKWGVGIKVQPQRRGDERQWQHSQPPSGMRERDEHSEGAIDKPWWRKAADIQHATEVRILSRSEAERRAMPNREPEPPCHSAEPVLHRPQMPETQHDSASAVSHEVLEAQLLWRNRATADPHHSSSSSTQRSRLSQQGPPLIDSQGIAMGIPVEWAMGPAGHTSAQPYAFREVQQQDAPPPEAPRAVSPPAPERYEELVEAVAMPVKQEKVKMGFQLYRPPTLITQATPEAPLQGSETREVSAQPHARGGRTAAHAAGQNASGRSLQPQLQQEATPPKVAVRAVHAAAKERSRATLSISKTSLSVRETAQQPKRGKSSAPEREPRRCNKGCASAVREQVSEPLPNSSASTERQRPPAANLVVGESETQFGRSGSKSTAVASKQAVKLGRKAAQHSLDTTKTRTEGRAPSPADESAQKQFIGRTRRVIAVSEKAREGSSAEQRSQPGEDRAQRLDTGKQRPSNAAEQPAGSRAPKESRAQPKQLLTELVKQAALFNASPVKSQSAAAASTPRAATRPAAGPSGAKLAAPPGLEAARPASTAFRKAAARS